MSDAQIIYLPRLDLPKPPNTNPAYYIEGETIRGLASIYMQTPKGDWWRGGRPVARKDIPTGLRELGVTE
ncbi:hypothetical protein [Agrococcus sp. DT81.2]|uniref:hypothetical protein n=1 Tax=Agrococcus sp. DT81.2 TaxID=3393414 RepID=UPI003CE477AF